MSVLRVTRDVTKVECPWLDDTIAAGTVLFDFTGHTYGCITPDGLAVCLVEGEYPFFELPASALEDLDGVPAKAKYTRIVDGDQHLARPTADAV